MSFRAHQFENPAGLHSLLSTRDTTITPTQAISTPVQMSWLFEVSIFWNNSTVELSFRTNAMSYALWLVFFYVFGGITFVPAIGLCVVLFLYWFLPTVKVDTIGTTKAIPSATSTADKSTERTERSYKFPNTGHSPSSDHSKKTSSNSNSSVSSLASSASLSIEREAETGVEAHITGWLTVSKQYFVYPMGAVNSSAKEVDSPQNESAYSALYKKMIISSEPTPTAVETGTDNSSKSSAKKTKLVKYFAVLRHGNLFLYNDSDQKDVKHVIVIANHLVTIWPPHLPDGELFAKRHSICLVKLPSSGVNSDFQLAELLSDPSNPPKDSFHLYSDIVSEKEDFYFALIRASKKHSVHASLVDSASRSSLFNPIYMAHPIHYKRAEMMDLIQTLHSTDANIQTRWFNALLGRMFLGFKDTTSFEDFFRTRLVAKLSRSKRPSFLSEIQVTKVSAGESIPYFTNPRLVELTPEGKVTVDVDLSYSGNFAIEVATNALINLGSRFKTREVPISLSIKLQRVEGKLVFKMKPPPSNRLWYSFAASPKVCLIFLSLSLL